MWRNPWVQRMCLLTCLECLGANDEDSSGNKVSIDERDQNGMTWESKSMEYYLYTKQRRPRLVSFASRPSVIRLNGSGK